MKKILFIDRDGTLINEPLDNLQVDKIEKLSFEYKVFVALTALQDHGYKLIMVTNQDGLNTKSFLLKNFTKPHQFMLDIFRSQGIIFDEVLICPHRQEENCNCRKPKIGMVNHWITNKELDVKNSYVIGDRKTDMDLARNMGISGILYEKDNLNWLDIKKKLTQLNRCAEIYRNTSETKIYVKICLDKFEKGNINTGINFFDHMLDQIATHSNFKIDIFSKGDIHLDDHHTIEDTGIALGEALYKSLGNKCGIERFGFTLPMDESLASCVLDISGRPYLKFEAKFNFQYVGDLSTEMIKHFFQSLTYSMKSTIHLHAKGKNDHHIAESLFKVFGRTLRQATQVNGNVVPSSKGIL